MKSEDKINDNERFISLDLIGSCTIRDTFEYIQKLKDKYKINKFVQNNTPITTGYEKLSVTTGLKFSIKDFPETARCWFKWFEINAEEKLYEYLLLNHSQFLIINLCECYYSYYQISNGNSECRLCMNTGITANKIDKVLPKNITLLRNPVEMPIDMFLNDIDNFCSHIKKIYKEKNIIFIKNYPARYYINNNDHFLHYFDENRNYNKTINYLSMIYQRFIKNIKNCKVISLPNNALGDQHHKWGKCNQHYVHDVYEYLGNEIDFIISNKIKSRKIDQNYLLLKEMQIENIFNKKISEYCLEKSPFIEFCERYSTIRVLIIAKCHEADSIDIKNINPPVLCKEKPSWLQKFGNGFMLMSYFGNLTFEIYSFKDQNLSVILQGIDARDINKKRYPIFIDTFFFSVNNEVIFNDKKTVSHDNFYEYKRYVMKNDRLKIKIKWCPYNYIN